MAIPASFLQLLAQQKRRSRLTNVPQDPYDYAVAGAEGASGRLGLARTQRLNEATVTTQAEQFGQSLAQEKLHFAESLAEQKRAAAAMETESALTRGSQEKAAQEARKLQAVGMGLQTPIAAYTGYKLGEATGLWGAEKGAEVTGLLTAEELAPEAAALSGGVETTLAAGGLTAGQGYAIGAGLGLGGLAAGLAQPRVEEIPKEAEPVLTGAGVGATIGTAIAPGPGTLIGAGIGAVAEPVFHPVETVVEKVVEVVTGGGK